MSQLDTRPEENTFLRGQEQGRHVGPEVAGGSILKFLTACATARNFVLSLHDSSNLTRFFVWKEGRGFYERYGFFPAPHLEVEPAKGGNPLCGPTQTLSLRDLAAVLFKSVEYASVFESFSKMAALERKIVDRIFGRHGRSPKDKRLGQLSREELEEFLFLLVGVDHGGVQTIDERKPVVEVFRDLVCFCNTDKHVIYERGSAEHVGQDGLLVIGEQV